MSNMSSSLPASIAALSPELQQAYLDATAKCNIPDFMKATEPLFHGYRQTYHQLILMVGGLLTLICLIASCLLAFLHLSNYRNRKEQRLIIRIILTPFTFAILNLFSIKFYSIAPWLEPFTSLYEGFALVCLFLLYVTYLSPSSSRQVRETFYRDVPRLTRKGEVVEGSDGSLRWFRTIWIVVFQLLLFRIFDAIASYVVLSKFCPLNAHRAKSFEILAILSTVNTIVAVIAIIRFYHRFSRQLKRHSALYKLVNFKVMVIVVLLQATIFRSLDGEGKLEGTDMVGAFDLSIGTPSVLVCCEMAIFSVVNFWAFNWRTYSIPVKNVYGEETRFGFFMALVDVCNIWDVIKGVGYMFVAMMPQKSEDDRNVERQDSGMGSSGMGSGEMAEGGMFGGRGEASKVY